MKQIQMEHRKYINALNSEFEVLKIKFHEKEQDYQYKYDILAEEKE